MSVHGTFRQAMFRGRAASSLPTPTNTYHVVVHDTAEEATKCD